jgi:hypothetical protein
MRFAATQKLLTFLMAAAAATPIILSGEVGLPVAVGFGVLLAAGWFLEPPLIATVRYRRVLAALMIATLLVQIIRVVGGAPVARMVLEYALILLGLKLCGRNRFSDYQQIAVLSFLQVIGATIATFDVSYAVGFFVFVVLCPSVLALSHLRNEMEHRFRHEDTVEGRFALRRLLASRRVVSGKFIIGTGLLSIPVLIVTIALFIGFPRFGLGFFGRFSPVDSMAGFTSEVKIGDLDRIRSEGIVVIRFEPLEKSADRPDRMFIKLRGAVFDVYENDTWKRSPQRFWKSMARRGANYPIDNRPVPDGSPGYSIMLESMNPPFLFVPSGTGLIETAPIASTGLLKARKLEMSHTGVIRYEDPSKVGIRYNAFITDAGLPGESSDNPAYLVTPGGTEPMADLARDLAGQGSDSVRARRLIAGLKRKYRYSAVFEPRDEPAKGDTPIDRFLFSRGSGTCEHFATSATLMLRSIGIPSRMITGFSSADYNPIGGFYAVRTRSAHAWTEAYIDGVWTTLDATPASDQGMTRAPPSTLAMVIDAIGMRWHRHVIGYDASTQVEMARTLAAMWKGPGNSSSLYKYVSWKSVGLICAVLVLAVLGVRVLSRFRWKRRRRGPVRREMTRSAVEATSLYLEFQRRMTRLGLERKTNQTPNEYLSSLVALGVNIALAPAMITRRYHEVRFGGSGFGEGEIEHLKAQIRGFKLDGGSIGMNAGSPK